MSDSSKIIIINGPNLNLLGSREPEHYGNKTLNDIKENCIKYAARKNIKLIFEQSNDESTIIEMIQAASNTDGIIIGLGDQGYILAIDAVTKIMNERVS